jgi:hypothetical protein
MNSKGRGSSRKGRRIPNNRKTRDLALWNTYRTKIKRKKKNE